METLPVPLDHKRAMLASIITWASGEAYDEVERIMMRMPEERVERMWLKLEAAIRYRTRLN